MMQILLPIIGLYNLIQSRILFRKEGLLLQEVINENDDFFTAMATMNFAPDDKIPFALSSTLEVNKIFTLDDIQSIAKETIIKTIMEFVRDEELLGIVLIKCMFTKNKEEVKIIMQPSHYQIYLNDLKDFKQSLILYATLILPIFAAIWYFFIR